MVDFNFRPSPGQQTFFEDAQRLDEAVGQLSLSHTLSPAQLLSLRAFKTPGSSDATVSFGSLVVELQGPLLQGEASPSHDSKIFLARFFAPTLISESLGDVRIREGTGAFGLDGHIRRREISRLIEAIEQQLIQSALERTAAFVEKNLNPAVTAGNGEERLAQLGVNLDYLKLIMNETGCIEPRDVESQSNALMKVLVNDSLVGALIAGLGGGRSVITSIEDSRATPRLLGSIADAFLVARYGLVDYPAPPLHALLQNKTTLALVGVAIERLARGDLFSVWTPKLPPN